MKKKYFMQGQTIIEVLVALTTAVVIVSAITIAVITSLRNVEYSRTQNTATRYAQEGMEFMRFLRDSNFSKFAVLTANTRYCLAKGETSLTATNASDCGDNVDYFSRSIVMEDNSEYCAAIPPPAPNPPSLNTSRKVIVLVSWTDNKCIDDQGESTGRCHKASLVSCLSDYTVVSTPGINAANTPTPTPTTIP